MNRPDRDARLSACPTTSSPPGRSSRWNSARSCRRARAGRSRSSRCGRTRRRAGPVMGNGGRERLRRRKTTMWRSSSPTTQVRSSLRAGALQVPVAQVRRDRLAPCRRRTRRAGPSRACAVLMSVARIRASSGRSPAASRTVIASEYGSSPEEQPADQTRNLVRPLPMPLVDAGAHEVEVLGLAEEAGHVGRDGVEELHELVAGLVGLEYLDVLVVAAEAEGAHPLRRARHQRARASPARARSRSPRRRCRAAWLNVVWSIVIRPRPPARPQKSVEVGDLERDHLLRRRASRCRSSWDLSPARPLAVGPAAAPRLAT